MAFSLFPKLVYGIQKVTFHPKSAIDYILGDTVYVIMDPLEPSMGAEGIITLVYPDDTYQVVLTGLNVGVSLRVNKKQLINKRFENE
jgi:hypothetical protein